MNEAELVLTHVLNCDRLSLYLNKDREMDKDKSALVSSILKRRLTLEPLQYILGCTEFMGLKFMVDKRALIPRPETEILVEEALKLSAKAGRSAGRQLEILDIGTGSACIAVSLAKNTKDCKITAVDISPEALELARQNADLHQARIEFIQSDLFASLSGRRFDLIISNPPYIPTLELKGLAGEISFEPVLALDGGGDGLDYYRRMIDQAGGYLNKGGFLLMEIGFGQAGQIENILKKSEKFEIIGIIKDYNNIERVMVLWIS
ncbi:peptide chain release factor N(5)-glutamine methyltransferase [bacterium]|nr:MAG: peptide chain release factor N(5)-glutamine methyltransferase [bacterium]